ncbi:MAG: sensor histidine kinase [Enterococcus sp.]
MNKEVTKKQRKKFFLINMGAFALIFLLLGIIILQLLNNFAYRETDQDLLQLANNEQVIQEEINRYEQDNPFLKPDELKPPEFQNEGNNRFNTQIILWSADGEILNQDVLGGRFNELENLELDTKNLDTIVDLALSTTTNSELTFHSITSEMAYSDENVAYIQFLANTNQVSESMHTFQMIVIGCMILFWLLSIGLSYYLSKMNMQPILAAWQKQQEFVENASHELRTPLTIIQNNLQRLFTKPQHTILDESEAIAQALNETRRLTSLTNDLLTIARGDSNQLVLTLAAVNPQDMLAELIKPFQEIAEMKQKHFIVENYTKQEVLIDRKKMHQVLVILLDNALKYTDENDTITLLSEISGDAWLIEVKNTGPSISDEDKKHIFERFYREDRSRSKETGGYGLGLAIAKQIVTEHHGKIGVRDLQPRGVIFQIKIPLK